MNKKYLFVAISLIVAVVTALGIYFATRNSSNNSNQNDDQEDIIATEYADQERYFVLASKFKTYIKSLESKDLVNYSIECLSSDIDLIPESLKAFIVECKSDDVEDLYVFVNKSDKNLALIPVDKLDVRFKTILFENQSIFDKNLNLAEYKLRSVKEVEKSKLLEPNFNRELHTKMFAGGEIIVARGVDIMWLQRANDNLTFLFDRIKDDIQSADVALSMLEHSYSGNPTPCPNCTSFVGDEKLIPQLKEVGLDILSLAGNHIGDGGIAAQKRTIELLKQNEFGYYGAGANIKEASEPYVAEISGVKYAFLGADDVAYFYWAGNDSQGVNRYSTRGSNGNILDKAKIKKDIEYAKTKADKVVFYMSWGIEYTNFADEYIEEMAHELIDNGADLILASHAHWIKNMEVYKGKLIVYSLGNFIFDQTHTDPTRESIYLNMNFIDGNLVNIEVVPILSCGYHFGAKNLAYDVISGKITYADVDKTDERQACVWLQPKRIGVDHPKYKVILDRLFEYTKF